MSQRFFVNPYDDYNGQNVNIDKDRIRNLIKSYVKTILEHTKRDRAQDLGGDLYVGDAGKLIIDDLCITIQMNV